MTMNFFVKATKIILYCKGFYIQITSKYTNMEREFLNKKLDETLDSTEGIQRAAPRPFLFTRIEARMQAEKNIWSTVSSFVARPVVAFACICFIIIVNASVIWFSNMSAPSSQQGTELATADEYSQVNYTLYEFENAKP